MHGSQKKFKVIAAAGVVFTLLLFVGALLIVETERSFGLAVEEKQPPAKQTRTLKFFIFQEPAVLLNPNSTTTQFSIFIGEKDPVIKDASIEIRGVTQATVSQAITADINQSNSFPTSRQQTFNLDSTGGPSHFRLLYAGSPTQSLTSYLGGIITAAGSYSFYLKVDISGADVSLLQARLVLTYQFTPSTAAGLPATGELTSVTFDTGVPGGAAYNSIMWKGVLGGAGQNQGRVRFQFSTSNSSSGPWTFYGSTDGGATCNSSSWYDPAAADTPIELSCAPDQHNNQRYFRYKTQICSGDCSTAGDFTPRVDDVVASWSP